MDILWKWKQACRWSRSILLGLYYCTAWIHYPSDLARLELKKPFGPHDNGWAIIKIGKGIKRLLSEESYLPLYLRYRVNSDPYCVKFQPTVEILWCELGEKAPWRTSPSRAASNPTLVHHSPDSFIFWNWKPLLLIGNSMIFWTQLKIEKTWLIVKAYSYLCTFPLTFWFISTF